MQQSSVTQHAQPLEKVLLKAAQRSNLKETKTFTIRNVDTASILSLNDLKSLIRDRFSGDIRSSFDVGYVQGVNVIRIRSKEDLSEMWAEIKRSKSTSVWCDGLIESTSKKSKRKRKSLSDEEDSEDDSCKSKTKKQRVDKDEKVQEMVEALKGKHGNKFTFMQIRIWAELIVSGLYANLDDPPQRNSMFERAGTAGKASPKADQNDSNSVVKAVSEAASAITSALSGPTKTNAAVSSNSPAKLIESRSKLYKQLAELHNLKVTGVFDDTQYEMEKETILDLLRQLSGSRSI